MKNCRVGERWFSTTKLSVGSQLGGKLPVSFPTCYLKVSCHRHDQTFPPPTPRIPFRPYSATSLLFRPGFGGHPRYILTLLPTIAPKPNSLRNWMWHQTMREAPLPIISSPSETSCFDSTPPLIHFFSCQPNEHFSIPSSWEQPSPPLTAKVHNRKFLPWKTILMRCAKLNSLLQERFLPFSYPDWNVSNETNGLRPVIQRQSLHRQREN